MLRAAVALSLGPMGLGLSRFGYSVLLPAMRTDLGWSYTEAGGMNTANAVGYLVGSVTAPVGIARLSERQVFIGSFAVVALAMLASGLTDSYVGLLILRAVAGVAGATLFIAGGTLATRLAADTPAPGLVLGIYFAGVGPGILISALLAPIVLAPGGAWPLGWLVMGALGAVATVVADRAATGIATGEATTGRGDAAMRRWGGWAGRSSPSRCTASDTSPT